jgi:hypothetical protein
MKPPASLVHLVLAAPLARPDAARSPDSDPPPVDKLDAWRLKAVE